jgi:hypothetical protein
LCRPALAVAARSATPLIHYSSDSAESSAIIRPGPAKA